MTYRIEEETPKLEDYMRLRLISGLTPFSKEAAEKGLRGTQFGLVVYDGDAVIGMGRVVGDGGCIFYICDIAVDPAHQGKGLGKKIMQAIDAWIDKTASPSAYINLMGDVPEFYERFGYQRTAPRSYGMYRRIKATPQEESVS